MAMTYSVQRALKQAREGVDAPTAWGMTYGECDSPECDAVHVMFFRRNGKAICRAAFTVDMIEALANRAGFELVRKVQA
jgi:hypothetical protein